MIRWLAPLRTVALSLSCVAGVTSAAMAAVDPAPSPAPSVVPIPQGSASPNAIAEDPKITARAKAVYAEWASGKVDKTEYTHDASANFTDASTAPVAAALKALGTPTRFDYVSTTVDPLQAPKDTLYQYLVVCPGGKVVMVLAFDNMQKIDGVFFSPKG
jgi:hypothetical protein